MNQHMHFQMIGMLVIFVLCQSMLFAQNEIPNSVLGNGVETTENSSFRIVGTVGQPLIGPASNTSDSMNVGFWYLSQQLITSVEQISGKVLIDYFLRQNYPNPFNPTTTIEYDLPKASHVRLDISDVLGRRISTLVNEQQKAGQFQTTWDGTDERNAPAAAGVYFCRIVAGDFVKVIKLALVR